MPPTNVDDADEPLTREYIYQQLFARVRAEVNTFSSHVPKDGEFYRLYSAAAFIKCVEYCEYTAAQSATSSPFFATSTLRGICEDLIVLRFLSTVPKADANEFLGALLIASMFDGLLAQETFFGEKRKQQKIPAGSRAMAARANAEATIVRIRKRLNWTSGKRLPSTAQMAKRSGLTHVYEFLFEGTSRWVHFSPTILARMGWGPGAGPDAAYEFSTRHFGEYYWAFNLFWGAYLLVELHAAIGTLLGSTPAMDEAIADVRTVLDLEPRWPELITPEELNLTPQQQHPAK